MKGEAVLKLYINMTSTRYSQAKADWSSLEKSVKELATEQAECKRRLEKLKTENEAVKKELEVLRQEKDVLKQEKDVLKQEKDLAEKEHAREMRLLKSEMVRLKGKVGQQAVVDDKAVVKFVEEEVRKETDTWALVARKN